MIILFLDQNQHKVNTVIQVYKSVNDKLVARQLLLPGMLPVASFKIVSTQSSVKLRRRHGHGD